MKKFDKMIVDDEWIKKDRQNVSQMTDFDIIQEKLKYQLTIKGEEEHLNCSKCLNRGYIPYIRYTDDGEPFIDEYVCECVKRGKGVLRMQNAHISTHQTFDSFKATYAWQQDMLNKAKDAITTKNWYMAVGQTGSGKTHICSAIVMDLISKGANVKYFKWVEESPNLTFNAHKPDKDELKSVDVLYIDDLFKGGKTNEPSNAEIKLFFEIIDSRYYNNKKTVVSSEYPISKLKEFDRATIDRVIEKCQDNIVNIQPDDYKNYRGKHLK